MPEQALRERVRKGVRAEVLAHWGSLGSLAD
jgi:hypothetical protein